MIGLLVIMIFSPSSKSGKIVNTDTKKPASVNQYYEHVTFEAPIAHEIDITNADDVEYRAILDYIQNTYQATEPEDAKVIARYLVDYGKEHNVDPKLAAALIARESGFNKRAISTTGARGLGQIKGFNFPSLGIEDPYDIQQNVRGTVSYLNKMLDVWKDKQENVQLALASYYKGHNAIKKDNEKLDSKTDSYVKDILSNYNSISKIKDKLLTQ